MRHIPFYIVNDTTDIGIDDVEQVLIIMQTEDDGTVTSVVLDHQALYEMMEIVGSSLDPKTEEFNNEANIVH